jgi:ribosomal protein S12 methylthiotransferase accessory factor
MYPEVIVFAGPSISDDFSRVALPNIQYRPPFRSGDLRSVSRKAVVGIIDGDFSSADSSPWGLHLLEEVRLAVAGGLLVYGSSGVGAVLAASIPEMVGVGQIFQMYCNGTISDIEELVSGADATAEGGSTAALVNVRYGVERLVRSGTIDRGRGNTIVEAACLLPVSERTYRRIGEASTLSMQADIAHVLRLLENFDIKQEDAQLLLETIASDLRLSGSVQRREQRPVRLDARMARARMHEGSEANITVWEYGDRIGFKDLVRFLKMTGAFRYFATRAVARLAVLGAAIHDSSPTRESRDTIQSLLDIKRREWGWESPEEAHVTMLDLGIGLDDVGRSLEAELATSLAVEALSQRPTEQFLAALRSELWGNELALKREVLRLGALNCFADAARNEPPPSDDELRDAQRCICRMLECPRWLDAADELGRLGVSTSELEAVTVTLALARRFAGPLAGMLRRDVRGGSKLASVANKWRGAGIDLRSCLKPAGSDRFCVDLERATAMATVVASQIGIVRIDIVSDSLVSPAGVSVAQAFGERSGWSSTFSSGKARTAEGARVGSIMEEVEIQAQTAFEPRGEIVTSFLSGSVHDSLIDPKLLDLPFDSRYSEELEFGWAPSFDLLTCRTIFLPSACLLKRRVLNDIYYSMRLGAKIFASNGLGAGFGLAEALLHALAEYIERHAARLAELQIDNPGNLGRARFAFVENSSLPGPSRLLVEEFRRTGKLVRILDITSEVRVPTFWVKLFDDPFEQRNGKCYEGFACHPNPEVALDMAILEAAQAQAGAIAGGRNDSSLKARSLGRHERTRPVLPKAQTFWFANDRPTLSFDCTSGFVSNDIVEELEWATEQVRTAGFKHILYADLTSTQIRPAVAVRVIVPGMETTNQLFTGPRARAVAILDLLPYTDGCVA